MWHPAKGKRETLFEMSYAVPCVLRLDPRLLPSLWHKHQLPLTLQMGHEVLFKVKHPVYTCSQAGASPRWPPDRQETRAYQNWGP